MKSRHACPFFLVGTLAVFATTALPDEPQGEQASNGKAANKALPTDWPRWRGPNADGVADGRNLPIRWSQTESVRWSVKLPGWGTSSPVVYGDRVFVTSQLEEKGRKS